MLESPFFFSTSIRTISNGSADGDARVVTEANVDREKAWRRCLSTPPLKGGLDGLESNFDVHCFILCCVPFVVEWYSYLEEA